VLDLEETSDSGSQTVGRAKYDNDLASKAVRVKGSQHIHEESKHSSGSLAGIPSKAGLGHGGMNIIEKK